MRVSSHKLATLLAQRLNGILPAPFRVEVRGFLLDLYVGEQWDTTSFALEQVGDETRDFAERLESAVHALLDPLQDSVSEFLHAPWPSVDGREMAMPGVRADSKAVHLWYGNDERAPVVGIPAIELAQIAGVDQSESYTS